MSRVGPQSIDSDRAYEVAESFFAELTAHGVGHVVISPGSRSTPLAITAHATPGLSSWIQLDERSAAFFALGIAKATRQPVALVCTSGTAAANYLPAVIEAHYSAVPLIVCTADRPPELRNWGAGQTIDQLKLFGDHARWFADVPVASDTTAAFAQRLAARAYLHATGAHPGPVHLNWPLREPLPPVAWTPSSETSEAVVAVSPPASVPTAPMVELLSRLASDFDRGMIVVGPHDDTDVLMMLERFSARCGWPVVAEATSQLRTRSDVVLESGDLLFASGAANRQPADVVVRIGMAPTSKQVRLWIEAHPPEHHILIAPAADLVDPSATATAVLATSATMLLDEVTSSIDARDETAWHQWWRRSDQLAVDAVAGVVDQGQLTEPAVVRAVAKALPDTSSLYVSNSMPVRDLDRFWPTTGGGPRVFCNRGASGIDGITSCALGVAATTAAPVAVLIGDVAFLHDIGGLLAGVRLGLSVTVVLVDNGGGQIFSMLPIAEHGDAVAFDELFTTPPGFNFDELAAISGIDYASVDSLDRLPGALADAVSFDGVSVVRVLVDPGVSAATRANINARVAQSVGEVDV